MMVNSKAILGRGKSDGDASHRGKLVMGDSERIRGGFGESERPNHRMAL